MLVLQIKPIAVKYKCPFKIRQKTVIDRCKELDFLKKDPDGSIHLKKEHKYYSQLTDYCYFEVWTENGDPFIEKVPVNKGHWKGMERNAIIFFKTHIAGVLLKQRIIYFGPRYNKPCLEPNEIEKAEENSVECCWCNQWHDWSCVNMQSSPGDDWVCESCIQHAMNSKINMNL